ncbi:MAG TPA: methyl-accepting chemotaxis protein [Alphaproteobacteria bacterium]|jgi:methyl-accepting chemotaxis protein|nr:methyl-accepting chemotaxis protein [Alphaproteobacteria bacterium]
MNFGFVSKKLLLKAKSERDQFRKWFESAMMMVDHVPISLMWCNAEDGFAITYMNNAAKKSLEMIESHLSCSVKEVSGKKIDVLFAAAGVAAPDVTRNAEFHGQLHIGVEVLDLTVHSIYDKNKTCCGAMVTWRSVTRETQLADTFEANIKGVVETISSSATELEASAQTMTAVADQANERSTAVAAASEEASSNVQTVAAAAEELSASITEIGRQVHQSNNICANAVEEARHVNATVQNLAEGAQRIGEVVALINDIADQTNLLALNATIEAARAGDAGKGFAVVANEVKSLANQTGKATEDIAAQITAIQGATQEAVGAIQGIGTTIAKINEIATAIAAAVEEQGTAIQEIARNVSQAASGTQDVSKNISGVREVAGEAGQASAHVLMAARDLNVQSEKLRTEVDKFLGIIRAA